MIDLNYVKNKMLRELKIELKNEELNKYPLNLLGLDSDFVNADSYLKNLYHSVWRISKEQNKPIYKSRQVFLESLAFDEEQNAFHFVNKYEHSSTLMGGHSETDEYYDPNWKMMNYSINGKTYSYIVKDLKARVFKGILCDWSNFHNYEDYLFSVSLENISIEDFNKLFTPKENADFENSIKSKQVMEDISKLIKSSIYIENKEAFKEYEKRLENKYSIEELPYRYKVNVHCDKQFIDSKNESIKKYSLGSFNILPIQKGYGVQMSDLTFSEVKSISLQKGNSYSESKGHHYNIII
ncbi:MAG: hypothetical protein CL760_12675 [Chloroflexi bacterium]|nr:hypothetical protein [Chloroflexota bacterium]|tara:strand:+ start:21910 stop:22797 length:888 start_codon:yes stop_codon:yes gene_type:complete